MVIHVHIHKSTKDSNIETELKGLTPSQVKKKYNLFRVRVNLQNFSDPEWVKKFNKSPSEVQRVISESKAILKAAGESVKDSVYTQAIQKRIEMYEHAIRDPEWASRSNLGFSSDPSKIKAYAESKLRGERALLASLVGRSKDSLTSELKTRLSKMTPEEVRSRWNIPQVRRVLAEYRNKKATGRSSVNEQQIKEVVERHTMILKAAGVSDSKDSKTAESVPELKPLVDAYNRALSDYRKGVTEGEKILKQGGGAEKGEALLDPLRKKLDQCEKAANKAIKEYSKKTGTNLELIGFNGPFISKYN